MRMTTIALLAATVVAGCDKPATQTPEKPRIEVRGEGQKRLAAANNFNRAIALKRAIMASGSACARVARTGFVGTYKNMDYWTASCVDRFDRTRDWAVFIGADDSAQARLCADTKAAGLPACTIKPGTEGDSGMEIEKPAG